MCDGVVLSDAAITVSKACAAKTLIPAYECVKITAKNDGLTLVAYDGEISIRKTMKADVLEEGEVCVNGKFFSDFVGKISDMSIVVSENEKGMKISYGDSSTILQTLPTDEFPSLGGDPCEEYFEVKQADLKNLIAKTVFCCASDDSRPILKGCLLEADQGKLSATALDGFRMAVSSCELVGGTGYLKIVCPARTLTEISRILDGEEETLKLYVEKNMLSVAVGDTVLRSKLYLGEFVRKENIFPAEFTTTITVNRNELIESVERAIILIRGDKNNLIVFEMKNDGARITANSEMGNVAEFVNAALQGKELKIAMNGKYLLDALKALEEESVVLSFNTPVSPFTAENAEKKQSEYLILPVRTNA